MTVVDSTTSIRQRREAIVNQHVEAENRHDVEAAIATFHHPRYELNGVPSEGKAAVGELLQGLMHSMSDFHAKTVRLRHMDDGVLVEGFIIGTHDGEWAGIPPSGNRLNFPLVGIFEFDGDRLLCEKVSFDMATVLTQMGVLPAIS
ncbi:hypothetical protein A5760_01980 [Mycobacterium colombiense]|uniref:Ester cyclase n=1 Tax=Mycobacterium colombiense TaxID=339268 RepID=A0A1A0W1N4_9MYCO|nr:ester cyclase [Mycobacterium colombiense]OBB89331.1 hypothetical protein A5760_01980 [Mycobacterium colombiense]